MRGFRRDKRHARAWLSEATELLVIVDLQKSGIGGYHVNYNLAFKTFRDHDLSEPESIVATGRNPACFPLGRKVKMYDLLRDFKALLQCHDLKRELEDMITEQLEAIVKISSIAELKRRIASQPPLDMYVKTRLIEN